MISVFLNPARFNSSARCCALASCEKLPAITRCLPPVLEADETGADTVLGAAVEGLVVVLLVLAAIVLDEVLGGVLFVVTGFDFSGDEVVTGLGSSFFFSSFFSSAFTASCVGFASSVTV